MTSKWRMLAIATALGLASPIAAQEATTETEVQGPAPAVSLGETVVEGRTVGEEYVKETFGDWAHRCVTVAEGEEPCNAYQLLVDAQGNAVAEISILPLANGGQAAAGGTIVTPLETLLTNQITLQVDNNPARRYPFTFCTNEGCVGRLGFTQEDVDGFKRGANATATIFNAANPSTPVILNMSLTGFTAAYDNLTAR